MKKAAPDRVGDRWSSSDGLDEVTITGNDAHLFLYRWTKVGGKDCRLDERWVRKHGMQQFFEEELGLRKVTNGGAGPRRV